MSAIKTAVRQHTKATGGYAANYANDGQQAYYLLINGDEETWFTAGDKAIEAWEAVAVAELWQGRGTGSMQRLR